MLLIYWGFLKNPVNDWLVTVGHKKKNNGVPPDFFVAGGMSAAIAPWPGEEGQVDRQREADRGDGGQGASRRPRRR